MLRDDMYLQTEINNNNNNKEVRNKRVENN